MESTKVTLLSFCATGLINNDESFLDYNPDNIDDYRTICAYVEGLGSAVDMGEEFFGRCEATNAMGTVGEFTFLSHGHPLQSS